MWSVIFIYINCAEEGHSAETPCLHCLLLAAFYNKTNVPLPSFLFLSLLSSLCVCICVRTKEPPNLLDTVPPGRSWHLWDHLTCTAGGKCVWLPVVPKCLIYTVQSALGYWLALRFLNSIFFLNVLLFPARWSGDLPNILIDLIPDTLSLAGPSVVKLMPEHRSQLVVEPP